MRPDGTILQMKQVHGATPRQAVIAFMLMVALGPATAGSAVGQFNADAPLNVTAAQNGSTLSVSWLVPPGVTFGSQVVNFFAGDASNVGSSTRVASIRVDGNATSLSLP